MFSKTSADLKISIAKKKAKVAKLEARVERLDHFLKGEYSDSELSEALITLLHYKFALNEVANPEEVFKVSIENESCSVKIKTYSKNDKYAKNISLLFDKQGIYWDLKKEADGRYYLCATIPVNTLRSLLDAIVSYPDPTTDEAPAISMSKR